MLKVVAILVVLCEITVQAQYYVPAYNNAFMYYQQPLGPQQTTYGFQQLRNQRRLAGASAFTDGTSLNDAEGVELPVQDDQNVESDAEAVPAEQSPVDDEPQDDVPAVNDPEAEEPTADEPGAAAPAVPAVVAGKKNRKNDAPVAPHTYFPINFGSTNGGAIAIANSYSTGKGGSATSTATAYGSPSVDQLRRVAPAAEQLRRRPARQY